MGKAVSIFLIITAVASTISARADEEPMTPMAVTTKMLQEAKLCHTAEMYSCFADVDESLSEGDDNDLRVRVMKFLSAPGVVAKPLRTLMISNCAVVLVMFEDRQNDRRAVVEGVALIDRNHNWRILPNCDPETITSPINQLTESEGVIFTKLMAIMKTTQMAWDEDPDNTGLLAVQERTLPGLWSSGEHDHNGFGLGIHRNGYGYLSASIAAASMRWKSIGDQVQVQTLDGGATTNFIFAFDKDNLTLELIVPPGKEVILIKVSTNEPSFVANPHGRGANVRPAE